jgi:hypothetical protein
VNESSRLCLANDFLVVDVVEKRIGVLLNVLRQEPVGEIVVDLMTQCWVSVELAQRSTVFLNLHGALVLSIQGASHIVRLIAREYARNAQPPQWPFSDELTLEDSPRPNEQQ